MTTYYEKSLFYQISSSAKYFDKLFDQFFKELNCEITACEHLSLLVISDSKDCCQRDLARIILKDRANTGKLVNKLEQMGLIKIEITKKNNKLVKILSLTSKGTKLKDDILEKMKVMSNKIRQEMTEQKISEMIENLNTFRQIVKKNVKTNI